MSATNRRGTATSAYRTALVGRAPMTLANMRHNGVRSLAIRCELCHHEAVVNVAASTAGGEIALRKLDAMEAYDEDAAPAFLSGHIQATTGHLWPLPAHELGLYQLTNIAQACGSKADKQKRATAVENGVLTAFRAGVAHLGEDEAKKLVLRVLRRSKRGQGKAHAAYRDARLLREYDAATWRARASRCWQSAFTQDMDSSSAAHRAQSRPKSAIW